MIGLDNLPLKLCEILKEENPEGSLCDIFVYNYQIN